MKKSLQQIVVLCLFLLFASVYAQEPELSPQNNFAQFQKSRMAQRVTRNATETTLRSFWECVFANSSLISLLRDPIVRTAWGVSDIQYQQIVDARNQTSSLGEMRKNPEYVKLEKSLRALGNPKDPYMLNVDMETEKMVSRIMIKKRLMEIRVQSDAIDNILTPAQKQKRDEALLANMSTLPLVAPVMFETLDLIDAQKRKMRKIKEECQSNFDKTVEKYLDCQMILVNKVLDKLEILGMGKGVTSLPEDEGETIRKTLMEEDFEYKKNYEECQLLGQAFAKQFKEKLLDVLTDEQWTNLQRLIDNPPKHAKASRAWLMQNWGMQSAWEPTVDLWKTNDAIPDAYRQRRNTR